MEKYSISPEKEYDTLRQEILKRIDILATLQNQTVVIVGVLLAWGTVNSIRLFLIPPMVFVMAAAYKSHNLSIGRISNYLIEKYQIAKSDTNWEEYVRKQLMIPFHRRRFLSFGPAAVFTLLSLVGMIAGVTDFSWKRPQIVLLIVDLVSFVAMLCVLYIYDKSWLNIGVRTEGDILQDRV